MSNGLYYSRELICLWLAFRLDQRPQTSSLHISLFIFNSCGYLLSPFSMSEKEVGSIRLSTSQTANAHDHATADELRVVASNRLPQQSILPSHHEKAPGCRGESARMGIHPVLFVVVCFKSICTVSMMVNILWPFVPAAIVMHFARPDLHVWVFTLNYIAMVPAANLLGFAGGELAKKLAKTLGILLETTLSSVVEIVLFMVLLQKHGHSGANLIPVIQAAILGSIMANLLLCLGTCFFVGGLKREEQVFHEVVSEVGTGLLLVAGFGLLIPSAFYASLRGSTGTKQFTSEMLTADVLKISRATSVILLIAFVM